MVSKGMMNKVTVLVDHTFRVRRVRASCSDRPAMRYAGRHDMGPEFFVVQAMYSRVTFFGDWHEA